MRLVGVGRIVAAQPPVRVVRPLGQVLSRGARRRLLAEPLAEMMEVVVELRGRVLLRERAHVRAHERAVQETDHERREVGGEEAPGGVVAAEIDEEVVVHRATGTGAQRRTEDCKADSGRAAVDLQRLARRGRRRSAPPSAFLEEYVDAAEDWQDARSLTRRATSGETTDGISSRKARR